MPVDLDVQKSILMQNYRRDLVTALDKFTPEMEIRLKLLLRNVSADVSHRHRMPFTNI